MNHSTELCDGVSEPCGEFKWEITAIVTNTLGIVANMIHLLILFKITNMRGTAYLRILQIMSVVDILSSLTNMLRKACSIRHFYYQTSLVISAVSSTLFDAPSLWRYYVLVLATVDRYTAICRPFQYNESLTTKRTTLCNVMAMGFVVLELAVRDFIFYDKICIDAVAGPSNIANRGGPAIYTSVVIAIPFFLTVTLSCFIMGELYRMRKRSMNDQQQSITNAAKYILILNFVFAVCLMPAVIWVLYSAVSLRNINVTFVWITVETFAAYSIINCIIYGWMSKSYQQTAARMLGLRPTSVGENLHRQIQVGVKTPDTSKTDM